jgi:hypothetical protein
MDPIDDIPETYDIQSLEQLRTVADELRVSIIGRLVLKPMTASQIAEDLHQPPNKIHYHVRELERVGLIHLVETRERGGVLEKYYRAVARNFNTPTELLRAAAPDDLIGTSSALLRQLAQGWLRSLAHTLRQPVEEGREPFHMQTLSIGHFWMTDDELKEVITKYHELLAPYSTPRHIAGEHERVMSALGYDSEAAEAGAALEETPVVIASGRSLKRLRSVSAGMVSFHAKDLEQALARGSHLDIFVIGTCNFAKDVTPELVERAISRFRIRGVLSASPEVREILKRKEASPASEETTA